MSRFRLATLSLLLLLLPASLWAQGTLDIDTLKLSTSVVYNTDSVVTLGTETERALASFADVLNAGTSLDLDDGADIVLEEDGTSNIASTSLRVGTGYSDTWNTEFLQITDSTHATQYSIVHGVAALRFNDTAGNPILDLTPAGISVLHDSGFLNPETDSTGQLGSVTFRWNKVFGVEVVGSEVRVEQSATILDVRLIDSAGGGQVLVYDDDVGTQEVVVQLGADASSNGEARIFDDGGVIRASADVNGSAGEVKLYNDQDNIVAYLSANNCLDAGMNADGGCLFLDDNNGNVSINLGPDSSGDGHLVLFESGGGGGLVKLAAVGSTPDLVITIGGGDVYPSQDGNSDFGIAANVWQVGRFEQIDLGDNVSSAGSGEGAQIIGITKDAADTMEADNFSISGDGNFYNRTASGDFDCTSGVGGVEDGWTGIQTTTKEIQFCENALTRVTPSVPVALGPLTLNCAAAEVVIDPRWENGILVEGSCGAN